MLLALLVTGRTLSVLGKQVQEVPIVCAILLLNIGRMLSNCKNSTSIRFEETRGLFGTIAEIASARWESLSQLALQRVVHNLSVIQRRQNTVIWPLGCSRVCRGVLQEAD